MGSDKPETPELLGLLRGVQCPDHGWAVGDIDCARVGAGTRYHCEARMKAWLKQQRLDALDEAINEAKMAACGCTYAPCPHDEAKAVICARIEKLKVR